MEDTLRVSRLVHRNEKIRKPSRCPTVKIRYIIDRKRVFRLKEDLNSRIKILLLLRSIEKQMEKLQKILDETWHFYKRTLILVATGSKLYYAWCFSLLAIIVAGFLFYMRQHDAGLIATNMNDQVSWGSTLPISPIWSGMRRQRFCWSSRLTSTISSHQRDCCPSGTLCPLLFMMAVLFVMVDLGRLDRFWHMLPFIDRWTFLNPFWRGMFSPSTDIYSWTSLSHLSFSQILLSERTPIEIHPSFHSPLRPLAWGFTRWRPSCIMVFLLVLSECIDFGTTISRECFLLRPFHYHSHFSDHPESIRCQAGRWSLFKVAELIAYAMFLNLFLLGSELFKEYYSHSIHMAPVEYLFQVFMVIISLCLGYGQPWRWIYRLHHLSGPSNTETVATLNLGCIFVIIGVWIEKGLVLSFLDLSRSPGWDLRIYPKFF